MSNAPNAEDAICPRCGAHEQATHHPLCQHEDGTPTELDDREARRRIAEVRRSELACHNGGRHE
jgi:hypothetical protein